MDWLDDFLFYFFDTCDIGRVGRITSVTLRCISGTESEDLRTTGRFYRRFFTTQRTYRDIGDYGVGSLAVGWTYFCDRDFNLYFFSRFFRSLDQDCDIFYKGYRDYQTFRGYVWYIVTRFIDNSANRHIFSSFMFGATFTRLATGFHSVDCNRTKRAGRGDTLDKLRFFFRFFGSDNFYQEGQVVYVYKRRFSAPP